jgi:tetratricopeptide (TPR) repeat protein
MKLAATLLTLLLLPVCAPCATQWALVRSPHFSVYSHSGQRDARSASLWFEQLRAFFIQAAAVAPEDLDRNGPVRVIGFGSAEEYAAFRPQPTADAYFLSAETGDYIVMPRLSLDNFRMAAHEYAHLVLHSLGLHLPPWLAEGIAEVFSTVQIAERGCVVGGDLPARTRVLRQRPWVPLPELLIIESNSKFRATREGADVFYAESWALIDMLVFSPAYAPHFGELLDAASSGPPTIGTLTRIYNKPTAAITTDLQDWVRSSRAGITLPGIPHATQDVSSSELASFEASLLIAELLMASGDLDRADMAYRELQKERPHDAGVAAALGVVALRKGDRTRALAQWKQAMQLGVRDAGMCFQYAIVAENAGASADEVAAALRRALELRPDFDDARYKLGLLESNRGNYSEALKQLHAMRRVSAARGYGYWMAMASALTETDQRAQAKEAAAKALSYASTAQERAAASRLAYIAETDLTVQVTHDVNGNLQMITTRKPHGTDDWNPFIEPGDDIRGIEGRIGKVECVSGKITGFTVVNASRAVEVRVDDPARVLITGGTAEFVCGTEDGRKVAIQYAAAGEHTTPAGLLRGMQFK